MAKTVKEQLDEISGNMYSKSQLEEKFASMKSELVEELKNDGANEELVAMKAKLDGYAKEIASIKSIGSEGSEVVVESKGADVMEKFARKGIEGLSFDEKKTMTSNVGATGGYLAGVQMESKILKNLAVQGAMRKVANVKPTNEKSVVYLRVNALTGATHVGETGSATEEDLTFERIEIENHILAKTVSISQEDIDDSQIDVVGQIVEQTSESFSITENADFITGNGVNKAKGILAETDATMLVTTASAGTMVADDLKDLLGALKAGYAVNGALLMNRKTKTAVSKLKDGAGAYIFDSKVMNLATGAVGEIDGIPVYEDDNFPDIAAGAKVMAFGDFNKGYVISDRKRVGLVRDGLTGANQRIVKFFADRRVGGQTVLKEAIKILVIKS